MRRGIYTPEGTISLSKNVFKQDHPASNWALSAVAWKEEKRHERENPQVLGFPMAANWAQEGARAHKHTAKQTNKQTFWQH